MEELRRVRSRYLNTRIRWHHARFDAARGRGDMNRAKVHWDMAVTYSKLFSAMRLR